MLTVRKSLGRFTDYVIIAVFCTLLWLPLADSACHLDKSAIPSENRQLASLPVFKLNPQTYRDFTSGLEAYYSDHFGFRKFLVRCSNRLKRMLFHSPANNIVGVGQQGWFYFLGSFVIDIYLGQKGLSDQDLQEWQKLLERRQSWLAKRGGKYLFVIAPDKQSIYPEFLPPWLAARPNRGNLDRFFAYMKAHSTVPVLDLRPSLLEAKKQASTYLRTDTHWNSYGACAAYGSVVSTLAVQLPDLTPYSLSAFEWKQNPTPAGDLARVNGQGDQLFESNAVLCLARPPLTFPVAKFAPERLPAEWAPERVPVVTEAPEKPRKIVLFRDSFANDWVPYFGLHFGEAVYVWSYNWNPAFLDREKPDVVVDEMLERFFNLEDPRKLFQGDALP